MGILDIVKFTHSFLNFIQFEQETAFIALVSNIVQIDAK